MIARGVGWAGGLVLFLSACTSVAPPPVTVAPAANPRAACEALIAPILATSIGLPTRGAVIDSAMFVAASEWKPAPELLPSVPPAPDRVIVPAMPAHCEVTGVVSPVDANAPPIRFQVNLPNEWNGRLLQLGGGGFNGVLVTGLALPPDARIDRPSPLMRGFVTAGTDSGHANVPGAPPQAFALNAEALENFAHASYKKVRDVAVELVKRRYGRPPGRLYYMGSSEGGREGLTMAQRYPNDYDGIFARVPVIGFVGLQLAGTRVGETQMGAGWLSPAQVKAVGDAVLAQCDTLDGLADGIVSDVESCRARVDLASLRCPNGGRGDGCLVDAQLEAVRTIHARYELPFPVANGLTSYPGWAWGGGEAAPGTASAGGWTSWLTGRTPQTLPPGPGSANAWVFGSGTVRYLYMGDATADPRRFDPRRHEERVRRMSALLDSTDPNLHAFRAHGGKLVIAEHLADYAQSPYMGIEYWRSVVARMGEPSTEEFLRLYTTPGADHIGLGAPVDVDMLDVLVDWVERGRAPQDLVQVSLAPTPPFRETRSRPMCRYPGWPRYRGSGDPERSSSFECVR